MGVALDLGSDHRDETENVQSGSEIVTGSNSQLIRSCLTSLCYSFELVCVQTLEGCLTCSSMQSKQHELMAPSGVLYYVK